MMRGHRWAWSTYRGTSRIAERLASALRRTEHVVHEQQSPASAADRAPLPGDQALRQPATARALRTYRRRALLQLLAGFALLVIFGVAASPVHNDYDRLERSGLHVTGQVTAAGHGRSIAVVWDDAGRARTLHVRLDSSSPTYRIGQVVVVLVDPHDVSRATIKGEKNLRPLNTLGFVALVAGGMLIFTGVYALARGRRQRRLLSTQLWRRVPVAYGRMPVAGRMVGGGEPALYLRNDDQVLKLAATSRWRLRRSGLPSAEEVDIAGDVSGYVVVRAAGSEVLMSARPPTRAAARERWRESFRAAT